MMAYEIALRKSDVFAAVAPVEGSVHVSYYETIEKPETDYSVSILEIHGVQDTTIPSNSTISDDFWKYEMTKTNMEYWQERNNCKGKKAEYTNKYTGGSLDIWCMSNAVDCDNKVQVSWCTWNGGHAWPVDWNTPTSATRMVWEFFKFHPK